MSSSNIDMQPRQLRRSRRPRQLRRSVGFGTAASRVETIEKAVKRLEAMERAIQTILGAYDSKVVMSLLLLRRESRWPLFQPLQSFPRPCLPNRKSGPTAPMLEVLEGGALDPCEVKCGNCGPDQNSLPSQ
ncbi:unnamed protein product [Heligmosomoides polygyrus]|uniref:Uncharacterized protein n=1 Tax=Heligmosomoides polygyrus TaxID=6339 RepID=A0A183FYZ7_HELPZ|nr:unnamed protein product [Heligmosomoides polygyrus]